MKRFRFEMDGSYTFHHGVTMGEAIEAFIKLRPNRLYQITNIVEEPIKEHEKP